MPKLSRMLGPTAELTIPVDDDEPLVVEYRRQAITPRLQGRLAEIQRAAPNASDELPGADVVQALCELYATVIVGWNLTDDGGAVIGTDAESLADVPQATLDLVMSAIREAVTVNPTSSDDSRNGSSPTGSSEAVLITTGS